MVTNFSTSQRLGKCSRRSAVVSRLRALSVFGALGVGLIGLTGCDTGSSTVSAAQFVAPVTSAAQMRVISDKLDLLRQIQPRALDADLVGVPAEGYVLGRLSESCTIGANVTDSPELLVYENQSRSLLGVNICPEGSSLADCGKVTLNYNARGIDDEQSSQGGFTQGGSVSLTVPSIRLQSGWILSYDGTSKNIIAFRKQAPAIVDNGDGTVTEVPFRPSTREEGTVNKNFGRGNGLLLSLVASGQQLALDIGVFSLPIITRFHELEPNKVLLFFSTLRAVHLLELEEVETLLPFDLNDEGNPATRFPVQMLRGSVTKFPFDPDDPESVKVPFMTFEEISGDFTGNPDVKVDSFQPIQVPSNGAALIFEQVTTQFLQLFAKKRTQQDPDTGENVEVITGGGLRRAILSTNVFQVLQGGLGQQVLTAPLDFSGSFYHQELPAIILFEEKSNNGIAYFYLDDSLATNLGMFLPSQNVLRPRTSSGPPGAASTEEPVLNFSAKDVIDNRLCFDKGLDQLLSVNYGTGIMVVVASRAQITIRTGVSLANITYVEPCNPYEVRAYDTQSSSLLRVRVQYLPFPVSVD